MFDCARQRDLFACLHEKCKARCIVTCNLALAELSLRAESVARESVELRKETVSRGDIVGRTYSETENPRVRQSHDYGTVYIIFSI